MKKRNIIVVASSRKEGNTAHVAQKLADQIDGQIINLHGLDISYYDYQNKNAQDDFLSVIRQLVEYDQIIFATPVYWYAMSAPLKTFFDRLSDLIRVEKELGRKLQGKTIYAISCGSLEEIVEGFHIPFKKSAEYMHMTYGGYAHTWKDGDEISEEVSEIIQSYATLINKIK